MLAFLFCIQHPSIMKRSNPQTENKMVHDKGTKLSKTSCLINALSLKSLRNRCTV